MVLDIDEQYDKIYRYCYYKVKNRETAEDITQETFLRYFTSDVPRDNTQALRYLYTVARNLCIDEYRRIKPEPINDDLPAEDSFGINFALKTALSALTNEDRELILLRYVNDVPVNVLCNMYGVSRFVLYRRIKNILKHLRELI